MLALACVFTSSAAAQVGGFLGPGVLSGGAGNIGTVNGQLVNLRFFVDASAVYDNGLEPFALNRQGGTRVINGLYGVQGDIGVYGTHRWRQAQLGLNYSGSLYHYVNDSTYDGSTQSLQLGYTYQKSRRLVFNLRQIGGMSSLGYGAPGFYSSIVPASDVVNQPTALLFDSRIYYLQSTVDVNYIQTARLVYTFGVSGFFIRYAASGLAGMEGFDAHGSIKYRLSRTRTIGVTYQHSLYDFTHSFGQSSFNSAQAFFATALGRRWTFAITAGAYQTDVTGIQQVTLDPVVAALLGQSTGIQAFHRANIFPGGTATLNGTYRRFSIGFNANQSVVPGNGVYLTSRSTSAGANYSYTGIRKWNFGINGGYSKLNTIGQGLQPYSELMGGAGITYSFSHALHFISRYDLRHQDINQYGFRRTSYRATLGISFSPGDIPLSLW